MFASFFIITALYKTGILILKRTLCLHCSVLTRDNGTFPECPQRVFNDTLDTAFSDRNIINAIRLLISNNCPGLDGVHPKFIIKLYSCLVKPLKRIFNLSSSIGMVLQSCRVSEVIPLCKNIRKPYKCDSYRPVRLTIYIGKIIKKNH